MSELTATLQKLLAGDSPSDGAWAAFAREYSRLLLHVARSTCHDYDESMDAYAFLLEKLREDGCRRLRAYSVDPRSKFTTWLVVVARRLCLDFRRSRYGRLRNDESSTERAALGMRRDLAALNGDASLIEAIPDESTDAVISGLEKQELAAALDTVRADLPPADRLLLSLRFDDGISVAEITSILGYQSQFHVYRRINSLLAEMKAKLEARGYESAAL
jgi:RNA polymerase sigma factor (sigma-70 family)